MKTAVGLWCTLCVGLAGCTGMPTGAEPVTDFDLEAYLGTWYEIARLDHRFERGLDCVTAEYQRRDDGQVDVVNRGYNFAKEEWSSAEGRARFAGSIKEGRLEVSFFGPFYASYNVLALDVDYTHALVSGPNTSTLWLLARNPEPDQALVDAYLQEADQLGFNLDELIVVEQGRRCPEFGAH